MCCGITGFFFSRRRIPERKERNMKTYRVKRVRYPAASYGVSDPPGSCQVDNRTFSSIRVHPFGPLASGMKNLWGNRKMTAAVLLAMLLLAAACLSACGDSGDMFVRIPEETLPAGTQGSQEVPPDLQDTAETPPTEDIPAKQEGSSPEETPVPAAEKQPEAKVPEEGGGEQTPAGNTVPNNTSDAHQLNGSIQSVGNTGFTVYRITTEQQDDGGMIAYSSKEENTLVDVSFTDQTVFTVTTSSDGGITSSSAPGTKADLEVSRTAFMTGQWEGDLFRADTVVIYHFG